MIRLIASDLDGTLYNDDTEISNYTKEIIEACLDAGIQFMPCSARTIKFIDSWLLDNPRIRYIVSSNGAMIYDKEINDFCYRKTIPAKQALEIINSCSSQNPYWTIDTNNALYSNKKILEDAKELHIDPIFLDNMLKTRIFIDDPKVILDFDENDVRKIHYITQTKEVKILTGSTLNCFEFIRVTSSHETNIEITHMDATKGNALSYVLEKEGLSKQHSIAFGDNNNDIDFLAAAGIGCSMENATVDLKRVATHHTLSNNENGVACFLYDYLGKENLV